MGGDQNSDPRLELESGKMELEVWAQIWTGF